MNKILLTSALLLIRFSSAPGGVNWAEDFYSEVEPIRIRDPMAVMVGSTTDDTLEIRLTNVGMYVGHICPGVAGAYRLTQLALEALYGKETPVRGEIRVTANAPSVALDVASYITGARAFYGCEEANRNALAVDDDLGREDDFVVVFQRKDTDKAVKATFHKHFLLSSELKALKKKIVENKATHEEQKHFKEIFQEKVKETVIHSPQGLFEVENLNF